VSVLPDQILHSTGVRTASGTPGSDASLFEVVADFESVKIVEALEAHSWSQTDAAGALKIPLSTLNQKIKRLGIQIKKEKR
jgi:DNA-binding NtrC family response regulator